MAWTDLGINTNGCYFHNFTYYGGGLVWIDSLRQVMYCLPDGSNLTRIDAFTSVNVVFPCLVNFKNNLYLSFWDTGTGDNVVYRYSGSGTVWNIVLQVSSLNLPRPGLACTADYIVATISSDYMGDTWDLRKSSDGTTWTSVAKPSSAAWDASTVVANDFDNYIYIALTDLDNAKDYVGYMLDTDSLVTAGVNLTDLSFADGPPMRGVTAKSCASSYYVDAGSPYNVYRSTDRGATRTQCSTDYYGFNVAGVGGIDFMFNQEPDSPWHFYLYCYKYGDTLNSWTKLDDSNSIVSGKGAPAVARVGDVLYIHWGTKIYYSSTVIDWPKGPQPPYEGKNQLLLSIATPSNGGNYFWTTWVNDNIIELHKRNLSDGQIVSITILGEAELPVENTLAFACAYDDDTIYVYGKMTNPAGLTGTYQIIRSEDGGTGSWEPIANWGTDTCGAMGISGSKVYAIRNGSTVNLYGGTIISSTIKQYSTLPLTEHVKRGGFTMSQNRNIFAASGTADSTMVVRSAPPYTIWSNITGLHRTDEGINRLVSFE